MQTSSPIKTDRLLSYFNTSSKQRGLEYFLKGTVSDYCLEQDAQTGGWLLTGTVRGAHHYFTQVNLRADYSWIERTGCTCPLAGSCKHAVALVFAFSRQQAMIGKTLPSSSEAVGFSASSSITRQSFTLFPEAPLSSKIPSAPADFLSSLRSIAHLYQLGTEASQVDALSSEPATKKVRPRSVVMYIVKSEPLSIKPTIEAVSVNVKNDGTTSGARPVNVSSILDQYNQPKYLTSEDREILSLWQRLTHSGAHYSYYGYSPRPQNYDEFSDAYLLFGLLSRMMKTGRCRLDSVTGPVLKAGIVREGKFVWHDCADELTIRVAAIKHEDQSVLQCLNWRLPFYLDASDWSIGPVEVNTTAEVLAKLLSLRPINRKEAGSIPLALAQLGLQDLIPAPPGQQKVVVRLKQPRPTLSVSSLKCKFPVSDGNRTLAVAGEKLRTAVISFPADHTPVNLIEESDGTVVMEKTNPNAFESYFDELGELGFKEVPSDVLQAPMSLRNDSDTRRRFFAAAPSDWLKFDDSILDNWSENGWQISSQARAGILPNELTEENLEFLADEDDGAWWFSLQVNVEVDGKRIPLLPLLLSAIRQLPRGEQMSTALESLNTNGKFATTLPDGQLITLPFERVKSMIVCLQELLTGKDKNDGKLSVSLLHAAELMQDKFFSNARWTGVERIRQLVDSLRRLTLIEPAAPPKLLKTTLRPYQQEGLNWLQLLANEQFGGILADDMGLGKTVELLAHICLEKEQGRLKTPFLVVCPTSVVPNWQSEVQRFAPHLKLLAYHGSERSNLQRSCRSSDIVLTTYPLLTRDIDVLKNIRWQGIALDEAQAIKNPLTQVAQAARALKARYRFCLTGTPIENNLGELWSQFQFLLPGLLGDHATFTRQIRNPIEKGTNTSLKTSLAARVRPFILRRTKQEVAQDLPEKTVIVQSIELAGAQRDLYETVRLASTKQIRDEVAKKGFKQSQIMILDALLKLRQVCCDPRLVKLSAARKVDESAKLTHMIDILKQMIEEGRKILVFSQFTSMLSLIETHLDSASIPYAKLCGDTKDRNAPVEQFQKGEVPVFLISLRAGGTGLNLTAADVVIHYDPWWNPAVEDQATDRAHRIGQTKKVFVYKFVTRGTIEERMTELQERKRALANCIYDQDGNLSRSFTEADLEALLKPIDS